MTDFRARCAELVAAMDTYPIRPKAHRDLCNQVREELKPEPLIQDRWYWVRCERTEWCDGDWFPALRSEWAGGGWGNGDCWEDWDNEVVEWRLIPLPEEA